jgi:hypothetical protein
LFQELAVVVDSVTRAESIDAGHGRPERRQLMPSTARADYLPWPGLQQVFRLARTVTRKKTGEQRHEVVYGVTSLAPAKADAARLLRLVRHHWRIEN